MKKVFLIFSLLSGIIFSIQLCNAQVAKKKPVLLNNISLVATGGFEVDSAYLYYEDGSPVDRGNYTEINKKIKLWIIINKGWKAMDGKVNIGASERILTNKGITVLNNDDLFPKGSDEGSIEDARYISLSAVITAMPKKIPYFMVKFKVWDKNGTGKITGNYTFRIQ